MSKNPPKQGERPNEANAQKERWILWKVFESKGSFDFFYILKFLNLEILKF